MSDDLKPRRRHRNSITGALIVITIGVLLLMVNLKPGLDAWAVIARYWPVAIILIGVGKVWEALANRSVDASSGRPRPEPVSATPYIILLIVVLICVAMWHSGGVKAQIHDTQSVEVGDIKAATANLEMPTGKLQISGGSDRLLTANFNYRTADGKPQVDYKISDGRGDISITQNNDSHIHLAGTGNDWQLQFADKVPLDLDLTLGAGEGNVDLRGMDARSLVIKAGTGKISVDLTGPRTKDLDVTIKGGIGAAEIRLPKDVGVRVHAQGGIGAIFAHGLIENGKEYTNDKLGKTPATIEVTVEGGIGKIELTQEP